MLCCGSLQLECPVCREQIPQDATCLEAIRGISPSVDTNELKVRVERDWRELTADSWWLCL